MKQEPLEQRVDPKTTSKKIAGPYHSFPIADIKDGELIVKEIPEPEIQTVKRKWKFNDWLDYFIKEEKPSTTTQRLSYKPPVEIARFSNVHSLSIIEKDNQYWIEYE